MVGRLAALLVLWCCARCAVAEQYGTLLGCTFQAQFGCTLEKGCPSRAAVVGGATGSFDLRVHPYIVVNPKEAPPMYHLMVNVTWRPPYELCGHDLSGFQLTVEDATGKNVHCFTVRMTNVTGCADDQGMMFWFWSSDLFNFEQTYRLQVATVAAWSDRSAVVTVNMPDHPDKSMDTADSERFCSEAVSPNAYSWISAFRLVHVKPWQRSIDVEFVAAPSAYCLTAYELRLMHSAKEIVQSVVVSRGMLKRVPFGNVSVGFGSYSFKNVDPGNYCIGVIPIDKDENNICKCPSPGGLCSCSLAILPDIVMPEISEPSSGDPCDLVLASSDFLMCQGLNGSSEPVLFSTPHGISIFTVTSAVLLLAIILLVPSVVVAVCCFLKKWTLDAKGGMRRYLLPLRMDHMPGAAKADEELVPMSGGLFNVLVIYSHDCPAHENAVKRLVQWLHSVHPMIRVRVDYLCQSDILENKYDWMVNSMKEADRVILVNSFGSFMRYRAKLMRDVKVGVIGRKDANEFDDLFLTQVDLVLGEFFGHTVCAKDRQFISVRLSYTSTMFILPPLSLYPCYELPTHMGYFLDALLKAPMKATALKHSVQEEQLCKAVEEGAVEMAKGEWFDRNHCRIVPSGGDLVSQSTLPMDSVPVPQAVDEQTDRSPLMDSVMGASTYEAEVEDQYYPCPQAGGEPIALLANGGSDSGFGSAKSNSQSSRSFGQHQSSSGKL